MNNATKANAFSATTFLVIATFSACFVSLPHESTASGVIGGLPRCDSRGTTDRRCGSQGPHNCTENRKSCYDPGTNNRKDTLCQPGLGAAGKCDGTGNCKNEKDDKTSTDCEASY